ncbi:unknown similar to AMEV099 [Adoxophyes honmai entomopoxvirus 'L']|uniref:Uncharacterized protein n=1 Tax=Adoxophyes honmai entomopoxvirus 'L' TaxID=1293540 RepID=A0A916KP11_9POXV|nr:unknown similar to AMEV099 [Adoxophyes honmai entomopoxvirus 'L']CCU55416.1 unknown similar to AMEV099 [Adoxophyes honmai entomopoxvirus 'L']
METNYINLSKYIIKTMKEKYSDLIFNDVNYEDDQLYIEKIFMNDYIKNKNFRSFNDNEWIESMEYVYLKLFSFFNNKSGTLLYVYNISDDCNKKNILEEYKQLIHNININIIKQKIINNAKEQFSISDNINYKINEMIKNINNYKEPTFIASLFDLFFYDKEIRKNIIDLINEYIPRNKIFENFDNDYYISEIKQLMILLMNINVGTVKCTKYINDYINTFVAKLFDTSEFLNKCILSFSNDSSYTGFKCCNIKKVNLLSECDNYDLKNIKYNITDGYKPVHIRLHIIHIIIKLLNISVYCYNNDVYSKFKNNINNSEVNKEFNDKFETIKNIINIDKNEINIINLITDICNNKQKLNKLFEENKETIREFIKDKIKDIDISHTIKIMINEFVDSIIDEINIDKLPDIDKKSFNDKYEELKSFTTDKLKPIFNFFNKKSKMKSIQFY